MQTHFFPLAAHMQGLTSLDRRQQSEYPSILCFITEVKLLALFNLIQPKINFYKSQSRLSGLTINQCLYLFPNSNIEHISLTSEPVSLAGWTAAEVCQFTTDFVGASRREACDQSVRTTLSYFAQQNPIRPAKRKITTAVLPSSRPLNCRVSL